MRCSAMTSVPASAEPHVRAVQTVLTAALAELPTPIKAYIGRRDDGDSTCVVIHGSPGDPSGSVGDRYEDLTVTVQLTAIGIGEEQALAYADAARAALLTADLTVPGRAVLPAWQLASQQPVRDDTVQPPLWYSSTQYAIKSNPA